MINTSKCPYCESPITKVQAEDVEVAVGFQPKWRGFSYSCPSCHKVLSVQINPLTIEDDIVKRVIAKLAVAAQQIQENVSTTILDEIKRLLKK